MYDKNYLVYLGFWSPMSREKLFNGNIYIVTDSWDSSVGTSACHKPEYMNSSPETHEVKGWNLPQFLCTSSLHKTNT